MFSRCLLLLLLGLSCLQCSTMAQNVNGAGLCCFEFHKKNLPASKVVAYKKTRPECTLPGVIFTMKRGFQLCADPEVDWVKELMKSKTMP